MRIGDKTLRVSSAVGFRAAVIVQAAAMLGQSVLAGVALAGDANALAAHMTVGGVVVLVAAAQVMFALLLWDWIPRWALIASFGLLIGDGIQMASGRWHLFVVHLPLGLALFAGLVPLVWWSARGQAEQTAGSISEQAGDCAAPIKMIERGC